jgi:hypothetical protein
MGRRYGIIRICKRSRRLMAKLKSGIDHERVPPLQRIDPLARCQDAVAALLVAKKGGPMILPKSDHQGSE